MSLLRRLLSLLATARPIPPSAPDPDSLSLRDWADLPAHHPRRDSAPC